MDRSGRERAAACDAGAGALIAATATHEAIDRAPAILFTALGLSISRAYEAALIGYARVARFGLAGLIMLMWLPGRPISLATTVA